MAETDRVALVVHVTATEAEVALVAGALEAEARRRQKAATKASGELMREAAEGKVPDKRPGAVKIANVLAEASELETFAERLRSAADNADTPESRALPPTLTDEELEIARGRVELGLEPAVAIARLLGRAERRSTSETVTELPLPEEDLPEPEPPAGVPNPDEDGEVDAIGASLTEEEAADA